MLYTLRILKKAADEAAAAYLYYERIQPGLGDRFLMEVLKRYTSISQHPPLL